MEKITNTGFYVNDWMEKQLANMETNITDALTHTIKKAGENGLTFFPKNKEWKDLPNRKQTQRPLTESDRNLLSEIGEEYNINRSRLITLMLLDYCKNGSK